MRTAAVRQRRSRRLSAHDRCLFHRWPRGLSGTLPITSDLLPRPIGCPSQEAGYVGWRFEGLCDGTLAAVLLGLPTTGIEVRRLLLVRLDNERV